jgi:hypothetical protein
MSTRSSPSGDTRSGLGRQNDDPRSGGSTAGALAPDSNLDSRQAVQGTEEDALGAQSEDERFVRKARSTPPMHDVRSDVTNQATGEPR